MANITDFITKMTQTLKAAFQRIIGKGEFIAKPYAYYPRTSMFIANIIRGRNA